MEIGLLKETKIFSRGRLPIELTKSLSLQIEL